MKDYINKLKMMRLEQTQLLTNYMVSNRLDEKEIEQMLKFLYVLNTKILKETEKFNNN